MKSSVFRGTSPCSPLKVNRHVGGTCCLHLQGCFLPAFTLVSCSAYFSTLKMKAIYASETSVNFQQTTWRSILKDKAIEVYFSFLCLLLFCLNLISFLFFHIFFFRLFLSIFSHSSSFLFLSTFHYRSFYIFSIFFLKVLRIIQVLSCCIPLWTSHSKEHVMESIIKCYYMCKEFLGCIIVR
jgi:hypothetical protein